MLKLAELNVVVHTLIPAQEIQAGTALSSSQPRLQVISSLKTERKEKERIQDKSNFTG